MNFEKWYEKFCEALDEEGHGYASDREMARREFQRGSSPEKAARDTIRFVTTGEY